MNISGKYKILIVDDDISIIMMVINILIKNPDYEILTTNNGLSACEIANAELPDLIIMDWQMPVMDGLEATRRLKQNDTTKDIPVIISTGIMIDSSDLSAALLVGAVDYLRKPIDEIELTARVDNMLKLSEAYSRTKKQNLELQSQLTSKLIDIQQLNELKMATLKQVTILKEKTSETQNQDLREAILKMERLLYSKVYQINWDEFKLHFDFVHQDFFKKIRTNFGDFTSYELRLCAFIKLNLSNKEIASIIFTTHDSVNTARKRLKKKFNLLPKESLQTFIHNI